MSTYTFFYLWSDCRLHILDMQIDTGRQIYVFMYVSMYACMYYQKSVGLHLANTDHRSGVSVMKRSRYLEHPEYMGI